MKRITEIAEIHSGYPFRRAVEHSVDGRFAVIQMRDLENYTRVNYSNLASVNDIQPKPHHFVKQGDILFISKGANNFAAYVDKTVARTVAAANFLVIRVNSENVVPEYLAWYINQEPAQTFLRDRSKGSYIPAISKAALSELEIPIPPLDVQRKIVRTQQLLDLENELIAQIQFRRKKMITALLVQNADPESIRVSVYSVYRDTNLL